LKKTAPSVAALVVAGLAVLPANGAAEAPPWVPRFPMPKSGLELSRPTRPGVFFDVVGRRAAVFGYEHRGLEAWAYPVKLVDDFRLAFRAEGYPLEFAASEIATAITVRPEATTFTYSHAAFTVRQTVFAPLDEPGIVMLLDVDTTLPLTVIGTFRPRLRLMWPAGLMTGNLGFDEKERVYSVTEESRRFAAVLGTPGARDLSVMPYQEEPRDVPARFEVEVSPEAARTHLVPIVIAGSVAGRDKAKATYDRLLASARALYEGNVAYYRGLEERTLQVDTPDERLDTAFAWAKVGVDKGLATNPLLGTGLVAGFRTSGESERPGFAWMFGRDALWTSLALHSYGDFAAARTALDFLRKLQRDDGKIPHEISQSASLIPWFKDYEFPWASADATPLYVVLHADHWRATGDRTFLGESWPSVLKAWRFTEATDTDGNGLVENTTFGHGWTEGSPPYPPHEEIYLQGVWIEACRGLAEMADAMGDPDLAARARAAAERTRAAVEKTYWLPGRGFYAFATALATPKKRYDAEAGPRREARQARIEALRGRTIVDEDTVLPAVPLFWGTLDPERAQPEIDHLGAASLAADWGQRLLSDQSALYDPLSYHYGSVWPLFTGWASVGAYRYGRPHVGHQALMANALLTYEWALGYVTELLSGDFHAPFGRSSHHQVWSEAMVVSPLVRGLLGLAVDGAGRTLTFAPQVPADWDHVTARRVAVAGGTVDLTLERTAGRRTIAVRRQGGGVLRVVAAPALAPDAKVRGVTVDGRAVPFRTSAVGDVQRVEVSLDDVPAAATIEIALDEGTDASTAVEMPPPGSRSRGLRLLRVRPEAAGLRLVMDGVAGRRYPVHVWSPRGLGETVGVTVAARAGGADLTVAFEGPEGTYVRRDVVVPFR
jgi:glycogen debranching enzyme